MQSTLFSGAVPLALFIAKATFLLAAAWLATNSLRRSTAGARHLVWLAALVGVLALPLLGRIDAIRIGVLPSAMSDARGAMSMARQTAAATGLTEAARATRASFREFAGTPSRSAPVASRSSLLASRPSLLQTLAIIWASVALSLIAWLAYGAFQVRRIVAGAKELTSPDWTMPLCEVADRLDLEQPPRLVISDRIEMAFACLVLSPTIVLPAAAESWSDDRRRAVIFHELSHVKRHDLVGHTLGRFACALYWFHPLVWTAAKKLRAESEMACDDLVLSCGARPSDYAQHLLDMVTSVRNHGAPVMALPMARKKEFEGRMLAILDPAIRRASPGRLQSATVVATLGALSLTIAAVAPAAERPAAAARRQSAPVLAQDDTTRKMPARVHLAGRAQADTPVTVTYIDTRTDRQVDRQLEKVTKEATKFGMDVANETLKQLGFGRLSNARVQQADTGRIALLTKVLATDTDAGVRKAAAWALADVHTPGARAAMLHALESDADADVREMVAWSFGDSEAEFANDALASALVKDKSSRVRRTAAWALGSIGKNQNSDVLVTAASDSDPEVRHIAIWALGQMDLHRAPAVIINALTDNSSQVRQIAAWSIGTMEDTSAVKAIVRAFETETSNDVKRTELWALMNIGTAPTSVIESAMKSSDPELRRHAVSLLSGHIDPWPWPMPMPQPRPNP